MALFTACAASSPVARAPLSHSSATTGDAEAPVASGDPPLPPANTTVTMTAPVEATPLPRPAGPTAGEIVRDALGTHTPVTSDESAWMPLTALLQIHKVTNELPATTAPVFEGDRIVWALISPPSQNPDPAPYQNACGALTTAVPALACAVDQVVVGPTNRVRIVVGWRTDDAARPPADLATPLRALSRAGEGLCLATMERTLHTVDITVRASSMLALHRALALMAVAPRLSSLLLVRAQPFASTNSSTETIEAVLSLPSDGLVGVGGQMGPDRWPTRCSGEPLPVSGGATERGPLRGVAMIEGQVSIGSVASLGRRTWVVTVNDLIGDFVVREVNTRELIVRPGHDWRRGRDVHVRYMPPTTPASATTPRTTTAPVITVPRSLPEPANRL